MREANFNNQLKVKLHSIRILSVLFAVQSTPASPASRVSFNVPSHRRSKETRAACWVTPPLCLWACCYVQTPSQGAGLPSSRVIPTLCLWVCRYYRHPIIKDIRDEHLCYKRSWLHTDCTLYFSTVIFFNSCYTSHCLFFKLPHHAVFRQHFKFLKAHEAEGLLGVCIFLIKVSAYWLAWEIIVVSFGPV